MKVVKVPARFFEDHANRFESGKVISQQGNMLSVKFTDAQLWELLGDAEFYSDTSYVVAEMGSHFLGLARSAQATVRALKEVLVQNA